MGGPNRLGLQTTINKTFTKFVGILGFRCYDWHESRGGHPHDHRYTDLAASNAAASPAERRFFRISPGDHLFLPDRDRSMVSAMQWLQGGPYILDPERDFSSTPKSAVVGLGMVVSAETELRSVDLIHTYDGSPG